MKVCKILLLLSHWAALSFYGTLSAQDASSAGAGSAATPTGASSGNSGLGSVGMIVGENYILKSSDVISVEIYQERDLDKQARIEGDGTVTLPLVGKVKVANMTVAEAQDLITDLYNRDYLVDPQISVLVVSFSPKFVRVLGNVGAPGNVQIPPDKDLTLIDAITQCRGVTRLGDDKNMTITRLKENGQTQSFEINFKKIKTGEAKDYLLQEGDTIYIPERIF
ncbi:MAG: polysaccharide biosynthesis/export family protein [Coraliomargarita sp.]